MYYVYILTNFTNTTFYTGVTNNLPRRIYEHKNKLVEGFTKKYNIWKLIYYEEYTDIRDALKREKQIKDYRRDKKLSIIKENNQHLAEITWTNKDFSSCSFVEMTTPVISIRHGERSSKRTRKTKKAFSYGRTCTLVAIYWKSLALMAIVSNKKIRLYSL